VERTEKSRVLLDILQDSKSAPTSPFWPGHAHSQMTGVKSWMSQKKKNPPHTWFGQKKKKCLECGPMDTDDLRVIAECRHIFCADCIYNIEEEVTEDGEEVRLSMKPKYFHHIYFLGLVLPQMQNFLRSIQGQEITAFCDSQQTTKIQRLNFGQERQRRLRFQTIAFECDKLAKTTR
jgi:hypothetical protein